MSDFQTHTVENQPPEFAPRDLWADDVALREALAREGGEAHVERVARYGVLAGGELYALSFDAHRDRPRLRTHHRFGHRIDTAEFHPHYHRHKHAAIEHRVAELYWTDAASAHSTPPAPLSHLQTHAQPTTPDT